MSFNCDESIVDARTTFACNFLKTVGDFTFFSYVNIHVDGDDEKRLVLVASVAGANIFERC